MSNKFKRLDDGTWGLACEEMYTRGEQALVERKDGTSELLSVGEYLGTNQFGEHLYRVWNRGQDRAPGAPRPAPRPVPAKPAAQERAVRVTEPQFVDPDASKDPNPVPEEYRGTTRDKWAKPGRQLTKDEDLPF